jgi:mRNA interferase HicA
MLLAGTRFVLRSGNEFISKPEHLDTRVNTCYIVIGRIGDSMRFTELIKLLKDDGWVVARSGKKHDLYSHPDKPGVLIPVSRHKTEDVKPGTLASIMKDAGLKKSL